MKRIAAFAAFALFAFASVHTPASSGPTAAAGLVAHEWGTFTSIAGDDGTAVEWLPLDGPADLPCFVERLPLDLKGWLPGTVRMETPVLYFYAPRDTTVRVGVQFRQGLVTEWFPHAAVTPSMVGNDDLPRLRSRDFASSATWRDVTVGPGVAAAFPEDRSRSHYYVARQADASPVRAGGAAEKFLFYRGVGAFQPPLAATAEASGRVTVRHAGGAPIGDAVLFENRKGRTGFRIVSIAEPEVTLDPPVLDAAITPLRDALQRALVRHGLYGPEAAAMVNTWADSWFEEGTRLFYIVSRRTIDDILPLTIDPAPASTVRVFVGRIELVTPATLRAVGNALASNDQETLAKYGRFLPTIAARLPRPSSAEAAQRQARAIEQTARRISRPQPRVCGASPI